MGYLRKIHAASLMAVIVFAIFAEREFIVEISRFQLPKGGTSIDPPKHPSRSFPSVEIAPDASADSSASPPPPPGTHGCSPSSSNGGMCPAPRLYMSIAEDSDRSSSLRYDFYRESCPTAERMIRKVLRTLYRVRPSISPALVRLLFHDCFVEGCDASVLLDPAEGIDSEKESPPNQFLKGFDVIDAIKSELESTCPEVVSCADILVVAAREAILAAGGPFYPIYTGRKDSPVAFQDIATQELPSPQSDLSQTLAAFASRGFDAQETVSLLGAHSLGVTHCKFFDNRIYNFSGTGQPDPSLDPGFLQELKLKCHPKSISSTGSSPSQAPYPSSEAPSSTFHKSDYSGKSDDNSEDTVFISFEEGNGASGFGTQYYRRLLQNRGLLYADQQLTAGEETGKWVVAYAADPVLFRRDFARSMLKLSNLQVLTDSLGQVRRNCSKVGS